VYMPQDESSKRESVDTLLAHELFHIFSRHHPAAADRLYALLGFTPAPGLAWPAEWADARLSNPDAPAYRHTIRVAISEDKFDVMPVLVARRLSLEPGQTIFNVLDVRLLAVQGSPDGRSSEPVRREGQLVWFPAMRTRAYLDQLGGNTPYVIHPEETMADNVAFLAVGRAVPNTALLESVRRTLATPLTQKTQ
jgi:hypothetical protein